MNDYERTRILKEVLESLIVWMVQSANTPITAYEARQLLEKLNRIVE